VDMEVRELLNKYKFNGDTAKVIRVRRSRRSTATEVEASITELISALDRRFRSRCVTSTACS